MQGGEIVPLLETGRFEGVLLSMNILNFPFTLMAAKRAKELGMGVGVMSPLGGGLIPQHEERLNIHIREGETLTESAIRFITHLPWVDYAYFGMRSREQIDSVCKHSEGEYFLSEAEIVDVQVKIGEGLTDACTSCMYCMDVCPKSISIASYMQLYNSVYLFGEPEERFQKSRGFAREWSHLACRRAEAKDCVECGSCETACTQKIKIVDRMRRIAEYEKLL
jgi:predicted aldo/keto reductase-like oxidoreductase